MGTDVAVRPTNQMTNEQLSYIAGTEFVPQGLRGNKPAILACVMTGRALGIDDMSSLRLIHVVNGRPAFSAELMVQIVRRHGHSISGQTKDGSCTVVGKRRDNGDTMEVTWTLEMAQRAGLAGKTVWKQYPEALLWARAVSQLCRQLFADCFAGGTYTAEEITDAEFVEVEESAGEPQADVTSALHEPQVSSVSAAPTGEQPSPADTASAAQLKKLNVLVGTLREAGKITTEDVYRAVPDVDPDVWPHDENGVLHWSDLRDSLTKQEASALIEQLEALETAGLTVDELKAHAKAAGIPLSRVGVACRELFGHTNVDSGLSDADRAAVWGLLETEVVGV